MKKFVAFSVLTLFGALLLLIPKAGTAAKASARVASGNLAVADVARSLWNGKIGAAAVPEIPAQVVAQVSLGPS